MDKVTRFNCLNCGKEIVQKTQDINERGNMGMICPFCNHVHFMADFIRQANETKNP